MKNRYLFAIIYGIIITSFTIYVVLDTLVIENVIEEVENSSDDLEDLDEDSIVSNDNYYKDNNIEITITTYREYDTDIYVADIILSDAKYLKTAFANDSYGKNITEKTSVIASSNNAILAINGDYYGVQELGYVLKNGVIYRSSSKKNQEDLVIYNNGDFDIINESEVSIDSLSNVSNLLSFGPALIYNSDVVVSLDDEVDKAMRSNPRTAIGIIDDLHYVFIVSDGRTDESEGLTLYELASFMQSIGIDIGYNLDGGGSSTMYFNGNVINNPTTNGKTIKERSVSDIVYIGY